MKSHYKKMIAPTVIVVLLILYFLFIAIPALFMDVPVIFKILGLIIPMSLIGVSIFVFVERINEIRGGQEDDLSQY